MAFAEKLAEGIVQIRGQVFTRCKARKAATCELTGETIAIGDMVYRPMGNPMNRYIRYAAKTIDAGLRGAKQNG